MVEKYIEGQKGYYENIDTVPVVMIDEEKEKALKIGYITLYTKFFAVTGPVKYGVCDCGKSVSERRDGAR